MAHVEAVLAQVKAVVDDVANLALESPDAKPEELYDALWAWVMMERGARNHGATRQDSRDT